MKIIEADAKNNQHSKSKQTTVKRMVEVWQQPPVDTGNAATATATQQAMAMRQGQYGGGNSNGCSFRWAAVAVANKNS